MNENDDDDDDDDMRRRRRRRRNETRGCDRERERERVTSNEPSHRHMFYEEAFFFHRAIIKNINTKYTFIFRLLRYASAELICAFQH